ncbi:galactoside-binding lectin, partial [Oesophagostomum dentatum]
CMPGPVHPISHSSRKTIYIYVYNCRFSGQPDKQLVINSYISNRWGTEERFPNPFEVGKPFQIRILVLENYFKIAVNGKHLCDYPHRVPVEDVKTIYIGGNIRVDFVEFQPPLLFGSVGHS